MKTLSTLALVACLALLAGCGDDDPPTASDPGSDLPESAAIFAPDDVDEYGPDADWTPSADDVAGAERLLAEKVQPLPGAEQPLRPFDDYVRQYTGVDGDTVYVNALCDPDDDEWRDRWIEVFDGGSCYWHAEIADGEIASFSVNGSA